MIIIFLKDELTVGEYVAEDMVVWIFCVAVLELKLMLEQGDVCSGGSIGLSGQTESTNGMIGDGHN